MGRTKITEGVIPYSIAAASSKKSGRKVFPRTRLWPLILLMPTAAASPRGELVAAYDVMTIVAVSVGKLVILFREQVGLLVRFF